MIRSMVAHEQSFFKDFLVYMHVRLKYRYKEQTQ